MSDKKDTVTYNLIDGNEVVYKGTTKDPKRREQEHRAEGLKFTEFLVTSKPMTSGVAYRQERLALDQHRMHHQGKNPKYNESHWD